MSKQNSSNFNVTDTSSFNATDSSFNAAYKSLINLADAPVPANTRILLRDCLDFLNLPNSPNDYVRPTSVILNCRTFAEKCARFLGISTFLRSVYDS